MDLGALSLKAVCLSVCGLAKGEKKEEEDKLPQGVVPPCFISLILVSVDDFVVILIVFFFTVDEQTQGNNELWEVEPIGTTQATYSVSQQLVDGLAGLYSCRRLDILVMMHQGKEDDMFCGATSLQCWTLIHVVTWGHKGLAWWPDSFVCFA